MKIAEFAAFRQLNVADRFSRSVRRHRRALHQAQAAARRRRSAIARHSGASGSASTTISSAPASSHSMQLRVNRPRKRCRIVRNHRDPAKPCAGRNPRVRNHMHFGTPHSALRTPPSQLRLIPPRPHHQLRLGRIVLPQQAGALQHTPGFRWRPQPAPRSPPAAPARESCPDATAAAASRKYPAPWTRCRLAPAPPSTIRRILIAQVLAHVLGVGGRDAIGRIRAGSRQRETALADHRLDERMARPAHAHGRPARGDDAGNLLRPRQHQCQRSRPERLGQLAREGRPVRDAALRHVEARDMNDDGIVRGPAFDLEDAPDRVRVQRAGRQPIHRFRRQRDHLAGAQQVPPPAAPRPGTAPAYASAEPRR